MKSKMSLADIVDVVVDNRGKSVPLSDLSNQYLPLIATKNVGASLYPELIDTRPVDKETYDSFFRAHPLPGDILFVNKGKPGTTARVPNPVDFVMAQDMVALRAKPGFDQDYVFALLRSPRTLRMIDNMQVGTMIPHFKKTDFDKLILDVETDLEVQKKIGRLYMTFSNAVEQKSRINDNLANLISTAFENTYERASAESTLGEVSEVTNGYAFKSKDLVSVPSDTTKAVFKMGNIQAGGGISHPSTKSWVEPPYFPKEKFLAREGDILMSMTDMKDNVRILGHTALMDRDKQYYVNQRVGILRATRLPAEYLYPLTNSKNFIQNLRMKANRGVQVNLTTKAIKESIVKVPDAKSLDDYLAIVNPLFDLQKLNSLEIDNLVEIRNEILNRIVH